MITWSEVQRRLESLERAIRPPASLPPPSRTYERLILRMNHERLLLDHAEREASFAGDGRLEPGEAPAPLSAPSVEDLQIDLDSALRFLTYLDGQRAANPGHDDELVGDLEQKTRLEITRLRTEIASLERETLEAVSEREED